MTTNNNQDMAGLVLEDLLTYQSASETGNTHALIQKPPGALAAEMGLEKWIRNGGLCARNVGAFLRPYLENSQHMHHPGFIGHQVAVPHMGAAIADMVHGVINNPMAVYEMGPSASVIELVVVNWMLEKCGWFTGKIDEFKHKPGNGAGVLTHGGSLANLTAVRVVLGHFIFVYIHPYTDGNGRTARFLMNVMLASGGYPWTVIPVERRKEYMAALETASVEQNIIPFAEFLAGLIKCAKN